MYLKSITIKQFRNHSNTHYDFKPKINIFLGDNGVGKTNILEAIYYLSLGRSFRKVEDEELIQHARDNAYVEAVINSGGLEKNIKISITKDGRKITTNNKPLLKLSDLAKSVNVILFIPDDVLLFKGPPKERRDFLNIALSKRSDYYLEQISNYEKLLKERNDILKSEKVNETLLQTTTEMLVKISAPIVSYRSQYIKDINDILNKITRTLAGTREKIEVIYHPYVAYDENYEANALKQYESALESDLKHRITSIGIHREDFEVRLNGKDIATYGSQGENRLVALALKLSPYFLEEDKNKRPIVALDDVMSELDEEHQNRLLKFLQGFEQVFITATNLKVVGADHYEIKKEKMKEVL